MNPLQGTKEGYAFTATSLGSSRGLEALGPRPYSALHQGSDEFGHFLAGKCSALVASDRDEFPSNHKLFEQSRGLQLQPLAAYAFLRQQRATEHKAQSILHCTGRVMIILRLVPVLIEC